MSRRKFTAAMLLAALILASTILTPGHGAAGDVDAARNPKARGEVANDPPKPDNKAIVTKDLPIQVAIVDFDSGGIEIKPWNVQIRYGDVYYPVHRVIYNPGQKRLVVISVPVPAYPTRLLDDDEEDEDETIPRYTGPRGGDDGELVVTVTRPRDQQIKVPAVIAE